MPSSFFDHISIPVFDQEDIMHFGLSHQDVSDIQYFVKYFNHKKIQDDFRESINEFGWFNYCSERNGESNSSVQRFFNMEIWQEVRDAGRMLKEIKNRAIRRNIIAFKGTVKETHDLITIENAKLYREDKQIKYFDKALVLDGQQITDNIISVLPKTTLDLILWGSQQHNCIGSYGDHIARGTNAIIVGFKDLTTGDWIGHAELSNYFTSFGTSWSIMQLRGKYNKRLNESDDTAIRLFLDNILDAWNKELVLA
jgi:hypothetical protein